MLYNVISRRFANAADLFIDRGHTFWKFVGQNHTDGRAKGVTIRKTQNDKKRCYLYIQILFWPSQRDCCSVMPLKHLEILEIRYGNLYRWMP